MDFNKKLFSQLISRYLKGKVTPEEKRALEYWFESLPEKEMKDKTEKEWQEIEERMRKKITLAVDKDTPNRIPIWRNFSRLAKVAAVFCFLAIGVWLFKDSSPKLDTQNQTAAFVSKINSTQTEMPILLEDGSQVVLKSGSVLTYPIHFEKRKREVRLEGEAFFIIERNPDQPFLVICGDVVTKVLGTSFRVKQEKNNQVIVEVKTGKVAVFNKKPRNPKDNGVIITPNQKTTYISDNEVFVTAIVEKPEPVIAKQDTVEFKPSINFSFNNAPLQEVIKSLEMTYGIDIELENEDFGQCDFTGDLSELSFYTQLDMVSHSLGAEYQIKGLTILLSGKGCQ